MTEKYDDEMVEQTLIALESYRFAEEKLQTMRLGGGKEGKYVDARFMYAALDEVVGPAHWSVTYYRADCCNIQLYGGRVIRGGGAGQGQSGETGAKAFRQACAALGLGRYLYIEGKEEDLQKARGGAPVAARSHSGGGSGGGSWNGKVPSWNGPWDKDKGACEACDFNFPSFTKGLTVDEMAGRAGHKWPTVWKYVLEEFEFYKGRDDTWVSKQLDYMRANPPVPESTPF